MDRTAVVFIAVFGAITCAIIGALVVATKRIRRREAAARDAEVVEATLAGAILNRQSAAWLVGVALFALAMGVLTAPHGPIDAHSVWSGVVVGVGMLGGVGGFTWAAMRPRGTVRLEGRALVVTVGDRVRRIDLDAGFELGEFALPPSSIFAYGGAGVVLRQGATEVSFWYPNDLKHRHGPEGAGELVPVSGPPENLRTNGLGRVIHERLRRLAAASPVA